MNKLGTKLGAIAMSAVMALSFAPSAAITSLAASGDDLLDATFGVEPVYRLYNPNSGEHLFTTDVLERDSLVKENWDNEGAKWNAPSVSAEGIYRLYNPSTGEHLYTSDGLEIAHLVNDEKWEEDFGGYPAFYAADDDLDPDAITINRFFNPAGTGVSAHIFSADPAEIKALTDKGYEKENGFGGYPLDYEPEEPVEELTVSIDNPTPKVGDTLTATVTGADDVDYAWTINDVFYADSESIIVPASAREGDEITVTVTDEDGNTAEDTVFVVEDLALISVEGADNGANKVVRAYFSEPVGDLQPGDIQIRKVSDNSLTTVESVIMSSDKMTATITLIGYSSGQAIQGLLANTDYRMIVTTADGQTAEKVFSIPGVADEVVVTAVDASKRTITVGGIKFTDENELIPEFQEVLGRTVTFEFDQNNIITSFILLDEAVIYTAITAKDANSDGFIDTIVDTDKNEYTLVADSTAANAGGQATEVGNIYQTTEIVLDGDASQFAGVTAGGAPTAIGNPKQTAKYAKIVLNGNGTVRTLVTIYDWDKSVYVKEVKETYIIDYSGAYTNLKDFTILKGGVAVTIDDIEEDDVVFVSTDNSKKIAEVYNDNMISGELTVYTGKADIGSDRYDLGGGYAVIGDKVVKDTTANLKDSSGADVVAYLDRANKLAQTIVDSEVAKNSSELAVLTEAGKIYTEGKDVKVSFKAGNGEAVSEYELTVSNLTSLVKANGTKVKKDAGETPSADITNASTFVGTFGIDTNADISVGAGADLDAGKLVNVIKNSEGTIIGLEVAGKGHTDYDFATADNKDMNNNQKTNNTFEGKMTSLAGSANELIQGTTPVYVYNKKNKTVVKYDYSDVNFTAAVAGAIAADPANGGLINARISEDGKSIVAFYIDETKSTLAEAAIDKTKRAVVADNAVLDKDGKNYAELTVYEGTDKVTYKTFAQDVAALDPALKKGDFVDVALTKDEEVYSVKAVTATPATLGEFVVETNHIDHDYILETESDVETTIVVKAADGSYSAKTWSELGSIITSATSVKVAKYGNSAKYVDAIYVELGALAGASNAVTFATLTSQPGLSTAIATVEIPANSALAATFTLQSSADGLAWGDVTNGGLTANPAGPATTTAITANLETDNTTAPNITAGTYYRIKVTETNKAPRFVNMTGDKTAAQAVTALGTPAGLTVTAAAATKATGTGAFGVTTNTTLFDQFGEKMAGPQAAATTLTLYKTNTAGTLSDALAGTVGLTWDANALASLTPSAAGNNGTSASEATCYAKIGTTIVTIGWTD